MTLPLSRLAMFCALLVSLLSAPTAHAEPTFSLATTPGRLPKTVVPAHYALDLKPDLEKLTLAGTVVADIDVHEPTDRLLLNVLNITIATASVDGIGPASGIATEAQIATLSFAQPISPGRHKLRIDYSAQINKFGRGLFYVDYPTGDGRKRMITSHLEPTDARRIFPSWDEPAFKATFDLTVTVPLDHLAVSNMPVASETPVEGALKRVTFERTPRMSTYLFVLVAGDLERITTQAEGVTVGVVATRGKSANGRYALEETSALLRYFNDYFGVKYPLPKLDLIAIPGGFGGAMENWGGITFFESRLLYDPATSPLDARRSIFNIIAHEVAHQWFGNLVTMAWWNNLWLNEGFASWMQAKSAQALHPDWQSWLNASGAKQAAMTEDARRTARAMQQPVANETEASAVFDLITYSKGQALIRMAEAYLGEDTFRDGIRRYMKEHAYSNATTADLWRALEAASGKPVAEIASPFTEQAGVPLIVAEARCEDGKQRMVLRRDRFTVRNPDAKPQSWQVPIAVGPLNAERPWYVLLQKAETIDVMAGACGDLVKLNLGDIGYYRVQYDPVTQGRLAAAIKQMSTADRINFLTDTWALAEAGRSKAAGYLDLVDQLGGDDNRLVVEQVIRTLTRIDQLQRGRSGRPAFQAYARAMLRPMFERLGWQPVAGEANERVLLRARLIRTLGDFGDEAILAEAKRRFAAYLEDPASLPPNLREPVTHLVGRTADRAAYDTLLALGRKTTRTDERMRYYSALASARDPALAHETLAIALTDELPTSMIGTLVSWVATQGEHTELAVSFAKENFEALAAKQGPSFRNNFISNLMGNFSDRARAEELKAFAPAHETSGGRMVAARNYERIVASADFVAQHLPAIDEWVARRGTQP